MDIFYPFSFESNSFTYSNTLNIDVPEADPSNLIEEREIFEPIIYVKIEISEENFPVITPAEIFAAYYEFELPLDARLHLSVADSEGKESLE